MRLFWDWYLRSFLTFSGVKYVISLHPSTDPVMRYWPSGGNWAHSTWHFWSNLICLLSCAVNFFSFTSLTAVLSQNTSMVTPGGTNPWFHFNTCPNNAMRLDGDTTLTSLVNTWAVTALSFSWLLSSEYTSPKLARPGWKVFPKITVLYACCFHIILKRYPNGHY